jgi:hypothetical protein
MLVIDLSGISVAYFTTINMIYVSQKKMLVVIDVIEECKDKNGFNYCNQHFAIKNHLALFSQKPKWKLQ